MIPEDSLHYVHHKLLMFMSSTCLDALPYPNTEVWTHNVNVSGKVSSLSVSQFNFNVQ